MRLRLLAPVSFMVAAIAGAFVLTRMDSAADAWLVLATGLALAAVTVALAVATQRRRRATREAERYFTLSPEMVILAGFDGYWKRANPAVEAVLGYNEHEALARPFMEFVHPDDRERTEEQARRVVGGATALAFENRIVCKDGSYKLMAKRGKAHRSQFEFIALAAGQANGPETHSVKGKFPAVKVAERPF